MAAADGTGNAVGTAVAGSEDSFTITPITPIAPSVAPWLLRRRRDEDEENEEENAS